MIGVANSSIRCPRQTPSTDLRQQALVMLQIGIHDGDKGGRRERGVTAALQDAGFVAAPRQRRVEVAQHAGRQRVALVRFVQRDRRDMAVGAYQDVLEVWGAGHC